MGVETRIIGETADGKKVTFYTLTNQRGQSAVVTDLGATWVSMYTPDKNGMLQDVLLGYDEPQALYANEGHMGAVVGRSANRIGGAAFTLCGKTYQLFANNGRNNLHSGPDYLERRLYRAEPDEQAAAVTFYLDSPEGDQGYPGSLGIAVRYSLSEEGALDICYTMQAGEADTLCNFTNHAYFNLAGHAAGSILSHRLCIESDAITPGGKESIPDGELMSVSGTPFDFREEKPIGRDIGEAHPELLYAGGYDHNFCLRHAAGVYAPAARVCEAESGREMEVLTDMPGLQFYTGNFLKPEVVAKGGAHYSPRDGFALETQYYPNAINVPAFEQPVIRAGERKVFRTTYRFGVRG